MNLQIIDKLEDSNIKISTKSLEICVCMYEQAETLTFFFSFQISLLEEKK